MTLSVQFYTMLSMIAMGSIFGAFLDTYSRFLKRGTRAPWFTFLNDILFWIITGMSIFYILFLVNKGEVRFYIFIALFCGFAAYQALFKKIYLLLLEKFIGSIIAVCGFITKVLRNMIFNPIRWVIVSIFVQCFVLLKGLLALVIAILKMLIWLIRVVLKPIFWILIGIWRLLPKFLTKRVESFFRIIAGYLEKFKKIIYAAIQYLRRFIKK